MPGFSNTLTLNVTIKKDADYFKYFMKEDTATPDEFDQNWINEPAYYVLSGNDQGTRNIYLWVKDRAGNISSYVSTNIDFDTQAPTGSLLITGYNSGYNWVTDTLNNYLSVTADAANYFLITENSSYRPNPAAAEWTNVKPTINRLTGTAEGRRELFLWIMDMAGNINQDIISKSIYFDPSLPYITFSMAKYGWVSTGNISLTLNIGENLISTPDLFYTVGGSTYNLNMLPTSASRSIYTSILPVTDIFTNGRLTFNIRITDNAGSVTTAVNQGITTLDIDTIPPVVSVFNMYDKESPLITYLTNDRPFNLTLNTSELTIVGYYLTTNSGIEPAYIISWSAVRPVTMDHDGTQGLHEIYAWTKDLAGNFSVQKYASINYDSLLPTATIIMDTPTPNNLYYTVQQVHLTINFNEIINTTNLILKAVKINNPAEFNTLTNVLFDSTKQMHATFTVDGLFGDGRYYFRMDIEDFIGNTGVLGNSSANDPRMLGNVTFDVATSIESITMKITDVDNVFNANRYAYTNSRFVNLEIDRALLATYYLVTSNLSNFPALDEINNAIPLAPVDNFNVSNYYIPDVLSPEGAESPVTLNIWVRGAGSVRNLGTRNATILVDRSIPVAQLFINEGLINLHAQDHILTVNISEAIKEVPQLTIQYANQAQRNIILSGAGVADSNGFYNNFTGVLSVDSNTPIGTATFNIQVYDKAGNQTQLINNRSTYNISVVPNPSFNITDLNAGLYYDLYSNSLDCSLNIISAQYADSYIITENQAYFSRPLSSDDAWKVSSSYTGVYRLSSGDGMKTVVFWVKDTAGNVNTTVITRGIILDTTAPTAQITLDNSIFGIGTHNLTVLFSEVLISNPQMTFAVTVNQGTPTRIVRSVTLTKVGTSNVLWTGEFYVGPWDENARVTFDILAQDKAENILTGIFGNPTFSIDTVMPNPTLFEMYDTDTLSANYANDFVVGVRIAGDDKAIKWMVSDTQETQPTWNSSGWVSDKPNRFTFKNVVNEYKKLYLWVQDPYRNVNVGVVSANIFYDDTQPKTTLVFNYRNYIKQGVYPLTLNVGSEVLPLVFTPNFYVQFFGQSAITLDIVPADSSHFVWSATLNVSASIPEGVATFSVLVIDNARNIQQYINEGPVNFIVDRTPPLSAIFDVYDPETLSAQYAKSRVINVSINVDSDIYKWYLSDTLNVTPDYEDAQWLAQKPAQYTLSSEQNGTRNVRLWVQDMAGNIAVSPTRSIYFDNIKPTAEILMSPYPYVKAGTVNISVNLSEAIQTITLSYTLFGYGQPNNLVTVSKVSDNYFVGTFVLPVTASNGEALIQSQYTDLAGNMNNNLSGQFRFIVDTVQPVVNYTTFPDLYLNDTTLNITLNISEVISRQPEVTFIGDLTATLNLTKLNALQYTGELFIGETLGLNRGATLNISVRDDADNVTVAVKSLIIDKTPPVINVVSIDSYPNLAIGQYQITLNVSEFTIETPLVYFETYDHTTHSVDFVRGTQNYWTGLINILDTFPEGICSLHISARDYAGNLSQGFSGLVTFNVLITLADPTLNITDRQSGDPIYSNEYVVSINIGNDNTAVKWLVSETQSSKPAWNATGWQEVKPLSYTLQPGENGSRKVYVWIQDAARNINKNVVSADIILDTLAPQATIQLSKTNYISVGEVRLTLSVGENTVITPTLQMIYTGNLTMNMMLTNQGNNIYTSSFNIVTNDPQGLVTFRVRITDDALNVQEQVNGDNSFILDTQINTPSFVIFDQETLRNDYTNDLRPGITVSQDQDNAFWLLNEKQDYKPSPNNEKWASLSPQEYTFKDVLNGSKILYLWTKDRAGNISNVAVSQSIIYDTVAPTATLYEFYNSAISRNAYFVTLDVSEITDVRPTLSVLIDGIITGNVVWTTGITNSSVWTGILDVSQLTNVIDSKITFNLLLQDKAGNLTTQIEKRINLSWAEEYGSIYGNMVKVEIEKEYLKAGDYDVTVNFNINQPFIRTPLIRLHHTDIGSYTTLNIRSIVTQNVVGVSYIVSLNVPNDGSKDGTAYMQVTVIKDNGQLVAITSDILSAAYIGGRPRVALDTQITTPQLQIYDFESGRTDFTNDNLPRVSITADADVRKWILSEIVSSNPAIDNVYWKSEKPVEYGFIGHGDGLRTIYLWVQDAAGNINGGVVSVSIYLDQTKPNLDLTGFWDGLTNQDIYFVTLNIDEAVDITPDLRVTMNEGLISGKLDLRAASANKALWVATINVAALNGAIPVVTFSVTVTDNAGNMQNRFNSISGTGIGVMVSTDIGTLYSNFVRIDLDKEYLMAGEYEVTVNFDVQSVFRQTPDILIHYSNTGTSNSQSKLNIKKIATADKGINYYVTMNVPADSSKDGTGFFWIRVTKDNWTIISITSDVYSMTYIAGSSRVFLDTQISTPELKIYDYETGRTDYTNDNIPRVAITADADTRKWLLSEIVTNNPTPTNDYWRADKPFEYAFRNSDDGLKKVYLFVQDQAGNINKAAVSFNIILDRTKPTLKLTGFWDGLRSPNIYQLTLNVDEELDITPDLRLFMNDGLVTGNVDIQAVSPSRALWVGTINISALNGTVPRVTFSVCATDNAGNVQNRLSEQSGTGIGLISSEDIGTLYSNFVRIDVAREYLRAGDYVVTVNFDVAAAFRQTPDILIHYTAATISVNPVKINVFSMEKADKGINYLATMNIPSDNNCDGAAYFWVAVTRDNWSVLTITSDVYSTTYIAGRPRVIIDTLINNPANFVLYDKDNPIITDETNDFRVGLRYDITSDHVAWITGEDSSLKDKPLLNDNRWVYQLPTEYIFKNIVVETKTVYMWARDNAGNITDRPVSASIMYNPQVQGLESYASVILDNSFVKAGTLMITVNIQDFNVATPQVWLKVSDNYITLNFYALVTADNIGSDYLTTLNIPVAAYDGQARFEMMLTKSNQQALNYVSANYVNIAGYKDIIIDTQISLPTGFRVYDKDTRSEFKTNDFIVNVDIDDNADYYAWIMGEEYSTKPSLNDPKWTLIKPSEYMLRNLQSGTRIIYLWVRDKAGNFSSQNVYASIEFRPDELGIVQYAVINNNQGTSIMPGELSVTLNIKDKRTITDNIPSLNLILQNGTPLSLQPVLMSTDNINGTYYLATVNIPRDESYSGKAFFQVTVTRNDNSSFQALTMHDAETLLGGDAIVNIYVPIIKLVTVNQPVSQLLVGDVDIPVMYVTLNNNTSFAYLDRVRITLSGNVFDEDIDSIYIGKISDQDNESIIALTNKGSLKNKKTTLKFNNSEVPAQAGSKYLLVMNINQNAVVGNQFSIYIGNDDILLSPGAQINTINFPVQSTVVTIAKQRNKVLLKTFSVPSKDITIGDSGVVLADFSLRVVKGKSYLSMIGLKKSENFPDQALTNLKLYKKNIEGSLYSLDYDELLLSNLGHNQSTLSLNFTSYYLLNESEQNFYIVGDLAFTTANVSTFSITLESTKSIGLDINSEMLENNIAEFVNTWNIWPYKPYLTVSLNNLIDDALFEHTQDNPMFNILLNTDHGPTTISALILSVNYTGINIDQLKLKVTIGNPVYILCVKTVQQGENVLNFATPLVITESISALTVYTDVGSDYNSTIRMGFNQQIAIASTNKQTKSVYETDQLAIRSASYPHKVRAYKMNYVNNTVSFNVIVTSNKNDGDLDVLCQIYEKAGGRILQNWTAMLPTSFENYTSVIADQSAVVKYLSLLTIPFEHSKEYMVSIKGLNAGGLNSEIFSWSVIADLTKPKFENAKLDVTQIKTGSEIKHAVYWGNIIEDVSGIQLVEVYSRLGEDPRWVLQATITGNAVRADIKNLKEYTSYYYKVRALNTAGLYSDYLVADEPISTSMPDKKLSNLSNYPNPFNSNKEKTVIYYFLNDHRNIIIKIYNIFGKIMYEGHYFKGQNGGRAGANEIEWDGVDQSGNRLPKGSYPMVIYEAEAKEILGKRIIGLIH
ncbi:MAG: hypothetical protein PHV30_05755 [Candidatus Margulisbacteria bacterium]|nr:hypothetical protein [Candidatus Margulisiibacteriota bacterium]